MADKRPSELPDYTPGDAGSIYVDNTTLGIGQKIDVQGLGGGVTPLSLFRYVDFNTLSTSRDGSIADPYKTITEANSAITDATEDKTYVLKVVATNPVPDSETIRPYIFIQGSPNVQSVFTLNYPLLETNGAYKIENIRFTSIFGFAFNNQPSPLEVNIQHVNCIFDDNVVYLGELLNPYLSDISYFKCTMNGQDFQGGLYFNLSVESCAINTDFLASDINVAVLNCAFNNSIILAFSYPQSVDIHMVFRSCQFDAGTSFNFPSPALPVTILLEFEGCLFDPAVTFTAAIDIDVITDASFPFFDNPFITISHYNDTSDVVGNESTVPGDNVTEALDNLQTLSTIAPLSLFRYVDSSTSATGFDGSIANPYNSITQANVAILDAGPTKVYTLIIVEADDLFVSTSSFVHWKGSKSGTIITGLVDIPNLAGSYIFTDLIFSQTISPTETSLELTIKFNSCRFSAVSSSVSFTDSTLGIKPSLCFTDCEFYSYVFISHVATEFISCKFYQETLEINATAFALSAIYIFRQCHFVDAVNLELSGTGIVVALFVGNLFSLAASITPTAGNLIAVCDSNFPFASQPNITVQFYLSSSDVVANTSTVPGDNVTDALDNLAIVDNVSTSLLQGGLVTQTAFNKVTVEAGTGRIVTYSNGVASVKYISWITEADVVITNVISQTATRIIISVTGIDIVGTVAQVSGPAQLTPQLVRDSINLALVLTPASEIVDIHNEILKSDAMYSQFIDHLEVLLVTRRNGLKLIEPNSSIVSFGLTAGVLESPGAGNGAGLNILDLSPQNPNVFFQKILTGSGDVVYRGASTSTAETTSYDNNGVLTAMTSDWFSILYVYQGVEGVIFLAYGEHQYESYDGALLNSPVETKVVPMALSERTNLVGRIIFQKGATTFEQDPAERTFLPGVKFGADLNF